MQHPPSSELGATFCSYCGRPPLAAEQPRRSRVCERCGLGMMLRATDGEGPQPTDPFLIVDEQQTVQAISAHAEDILGINEPDSVNAQLEDFLEPTIGRLDEETLGRALTLAVHGRQPAAALELRATEDPMRRFRARVTSCGDPPAALLVLAVA